MNEKKPLKKAETLKDPSESLDNVQNDSSVKDSTQKNHNTEMYNRVYDLLPLGGHDPVTMTELSFLLKTSKRHVRGIISRMRQNDYLICSNERGYFKPESIKELQAWYKQAYSRAQTTMKTLHHARQILQQRGNYE